MVVPTATVILKSFVSAHSLASLTFFTSDEFFQLKLRKKWVFQQAANRPNRPVRGNRPTISKEHNHRSQSNAHEQVRSWLWSLDHV